jgi:hypothetical protein
MPRFSRTAGGSRSSRRPNERRRRQDHGGQIWLLSRQGGEARRLTTRKAARRVQWSRIPARLVFVGDDPDHEEDKTGEDKTPKKPIVIDRYGFKRDREGYLVHGDRISTW